MTITVGGLVGVGGFTGGLGSAWGPVFTCSGAGGSIGPVSALVSPAESALDSFVGSAVVSGAAVSATGAPSIGVVLGGGSVGPVLTRGF